MAWSGFIGCSKRPPCWAVSSIPRAAEGDLLEAAFHELQPLLEKALAQETKDDTAHEMAVTAHGLAKAAEILAGQFTLVATNVPYLGRGKQDEVLRDYCERVHPEAKPTLRPASWNDASISARRAEPQLCHTAEMVVSWHIYEISAGSLLEESLELCCATRRHVHFETISGEVVNVSSFICARETRTVRTDVSSALTSQQEPSSTEKAKALAQANALTG